MAFTAEDARHYLALAAQSAFGNNAIPAVYTVS